MEPSPTALEVRPVEHANVSQCIALRIASLGSLVIGRPPAYPGYREASEDSIHRDLDTKPHIHHLEVVDPNNDTEIYANGRPDLDKLRQPFDPTGKEIYGLGILREAAHDYFCERNREMGKRPHMLLALLVTSNQHRRRGAGSMLVKWGLEKSEETGLLAYLQASEEGRRFYGHHGFEEIETAEFDLSKYGLEGVEPMTEMLRTPLRKQEL